MMLRKVVMVAVLVAICATVGFTSRQRGLSDAALEALASPLRFDVRPVNSEPAGARSERAVAPGLAPISSWISAVGAAAALVDLEGDGSASEVCLTDPRDDSVRLIPALADRDPQVTAVELTAVGPPLPSTVAPMGCVPGDLDEDGDPDLVVYFWGRTPALYVNRHEGGGPWSERSFVRFDLVADEIWNTTALNVADVDGDGHLDVFVGNYFPDGARVLDPSATDDPRMAMQDSMSLARNGGRNRLLLTVPDGKDRAPKVTDASGALPRLSVGAWTLATGFQDLTGDLLPELYLANDFGPDNLLVNDSEAGKPAFHMLTGGRDWTTPKSKVLGRDSYKGMGVTFSYEGGRHLPSIYVSNITNEFALEESNLAFVPDRSARSIADGWAYDERSEELGLARSGWSWDIRAVDLDNDGTDELLQATGFVAGARNRWPELQELAMGNDRLLSDVDVWPRFGPGDDLSGHEPNRLWRRASDGTFHDVAGLVGLGQRVVSRGFATGDVDGDGRLDVVVANQWADSVLALNRSRGVAPAASLSLWLDTGNGGRTRAIGAQVVCADEGPRCHAQLYPGNGHAGGSDDIFHIPLADGRSRAVTVRWRAGGSTHTAELMVTGPRTTAVLDHDGGATLE